MSRILIVLFVLLAFTVPAFAQDVDSSAPAIEVVETNYILLGALAGAAIAASILLPALLSAVRKLAESAPAWVLDIVDRNDDDVYSYVDSRFEELKKLVEATPNDLDDKAMEYVITKWDELKAELRDIVRPAA